MRNRDVCRSGRRWPGGTSVAGAVKPDLCDRRAPYGESMKSVVRWALALAMMFAGVSHLTFARRDFQAQVPDALVEKGPLDRDAVVVASGVVEAAFGLSLLVLPKERRRIGAALAAFFVAIFPGNIDQWRKGRSAFGLDTDKKRFGRLFFQPLLVAAAWWSTR